MLIRLLSNPPQKQKREQEKSTDLRSIFIRGTSIKSAEPGPKCFYDVMLSFPRVKTVTYGATDEQFTAGHFFLALLL